MAATSSERVGVLVLRLWLEGTTDQPELRARIRATIDVTTPGVKEETFACAGVDDTCASVCRWVTRFAARSAPADAGGV
jgi:hypothetical protein